MSGLVGYASSDEDDDVQPSKPAKIAKTDAHDTTRKTIAKCTASRGPDDLEGYADQPQASSTSRPANDEPSLPAKPPADQHDRPPLAKPSAIPGPSEPQGPTTAPGPTSAAQDQDLDASPPASPYTTERSLLRNLTMPTHPNFNIPGSPSPPPLNSEEAAALAATTKKFERFLELKKQGVHFNARLENNASLRNPSLLPKLMEFAGIRGEGVEGYASTLSAEAGGVPTQWPEEWYVESLVKENERRERKAKGGRTEVGFVKEKVKEGTKSGVSSKGSTPGGGSGSEHRKSKFERR